jgi:hypothetical protein
LIGPSLDGRGKKSVIIKFKPFCQMPMSTAFKTADDLIAETKTTLNPFHLVSMLI